MPEAAVVVVAEVAAVVAEEVVFAAVAFAAAGFPWRRVSWPWPWLGMGWLRRTGLLLQLSLGSGDLPILLSSP